MTNQDSVALARNVRKTCLELVRAANASHIGGAFSVADVLSVLYANVLHYNPENPEYADRDRFFYSKGHACTALYAVLKEVGFFSAEQLSAFSTNGSYFTTHVNHKVPGIELSTGSLGHALSVACGVALAGKRKSAFWKVYCVLSDGELDEGSNLEALLFAPHHALDNLTLIIDYNKIQSLGAVSDVLKLEPLAAKFSSFGWHVLEINGHDHPAILEALSVPSASAKPKVIIAHTVKGKGVDFMENQLAWHYKSPSQSQFDLAMQQLDA